MNNYKWELADRAQVWSEYGVIYTYEWDKEGDWVKCLGEPWGALDEEDNISDPELPAIKDDDPFMAVGYYGWKF